MQKRQTQDIQAELSREAREQEMMRISMERKASSSGNLSNRGGRDESDRDSVGTGGGVSDSSDSARGDDGYWEGGLPGGEGGTRSAVLNT